MGYRRMNRNEFYHYGILGMRWGHRNSREMVLTKRRMLKARKKKIKENEKKAKRAEKEIIKAEKLSKKALKKAEKNRDTDSLRKLSDTELREKIARLELEKRYKELMSPVKPERKKAGRDFVTKIIANSTNNVGQQLVTYAMVAAINNIAGKVIVNPKKISKIQGLKYN